MSPYNLKLAPEGEYCGYLRKSRADLDAESRGEGDTYERHERILLDLARRNKIILTKIYREKPMSGERISERQEMINLLDDVDSGKWKGVLVVEVERLARGDTMDQGIVAQSFKYSNTLIVTPNRTFDPTNSDDEEYFEFGLFMSRREFKTINRRQQRGRVESIKEGKFVGNRAAYGYNRVKLQGKGFSLEPHPEQAHIVQLIFSIYTDPDSEKQMGTGKLAKMLNDMAIPTQQNKKWTVATVNGILRNPVYIGILRWGSRATVRRKDGKSRPRKTREDCLESKGLHPAIIDEVTYNRAQLIMSGNSRPFTITGKISNPLAGLIKCDMCGHAIVLRPYGGKNPDSLICSTQGCANVSSYFSLVEDRLLNGLKEWLEAYKGQWLSNKPQVQSEDDKKIKAYEKLLNSLNKGLGELNEQLNNLHDLLEQKVYTVPVFLERSQIITQRIQETNVAINHTEQALLNEQRGIIAKNDTIPLVEHVLNVYHQKESASDKNNLLRTVLESVTYRKEVGGRWKAAMDKFTLTLYPRVYKG